MILLSPLKNKCQYLIQYKNNFQVGIRNIECQFNLKVNKIRFSFFLHLYVRLDTYPSYIFISMYNIPNSKQKVRSL